MFECSPNPVKLKQTVAQSEVAQHGLCFMIIRNCFGVTTSCPFFVV